MSFLMRYVSPLKIPLSCSKATGIPIIKMRALVSYPEDSMIFYYLMLNGVIWPEEKLRESFLRLRKTLMGQKIPIKSLDSW